METVHCASLYRKEMAAVHMQIPRHPLRGGQHPPQPCPTAAGTGRAGAHRAQTRSVATQGSSTGKKVGLTEAGCAGGKGGSVFIVVCGGRTLGLMQRQALADSFLVSGVGSPVVICSLGTVLVWFIETLPKSNCGH